MPELLSGLLIGGVGQAISSGINGIFGGIARRDAYRLNEMAADNADARYRNMFKDLYAPEAQMQQLKDAGLSPSMYYAGQTAGSQGASMAQGEGSSGMGNPSGQLNALTEAQINNINADTKLKEADTKKKNKETDMTSEQIKNIIQDTNNKFLLGEYKAMENSIQSMQVSLQGEFAEREFEYKVDILQKQTEIVVEQLEQERVKTKINQETQETIINSINKQYEKLCIDTCNTKLQGKLTEAEIKQIGTQIWKWKEEIVLKDTELYQELLLRSKELSLQNKGLEQKDIELLMKQIAGIFKAAKYANKLTE